MTTQLTTKTNRPTMPSVSFDFRAGQLREHDEPTQAGMTYFLNEDGRAYDYAHNDAWETIQNFATECASVIVIESEPKTEADLRAFLVASKERELYADCFGA